MSVIPRDTANLLLRALSDADYALLAPGLRRTQLRMRQVLVERNQPIEQLYFFDAGVASVVSDDEEGDAVEIGLFGREGMSGSAGLLGGARPRRRWAARAGRRAAGGGRPPERPRRAPPAGRRGGCRG